jgi:hypothetical protein
VLVGASLAVADQVCESRVNVVEPVCEVDSVLEVVLVVETVNVRVPVSDVDRLSVGGGV